MQVIIGKQFTRGNDTTVYIPKNVENDFVIFESGAKCKLSTFFADFKEANIINENASSNILKNDEEIDPDKFFNTPIADNNLLTQLDNVARNPNAVTNSSKLRESVEAGSGKNVKDLSEVKPINKPIEMNETPLDLLKKNQNNTNPLNDRLTENTAPVNDTTPQHQQTNRLPEWDMFDRVKKSETVTLNIPIKISLPKAQRIEALNDMFETSFIAYIAKQYIQNELTGKSKSFQIEIQNQIEHWMNEQLDGGVKHTKKKQAKKKETDIPTETTKTVNVESNSGGLSVADLHKNKNMVEWNGNISTLESIQTNEQLDAVNKKISKMKDNGDAESKEFERLQEMVVEYRAMTGQ